MPVDYEIQEQTLTRPDGRDLTIFHVATIHPGARPHVSSDGGDTFKTRAAAEAEIERRKRTGRA